MSLPHLVRRKLATFAATIRAWENWPAVARARPSASATVDALHFRGGFEAESRALYNEVYFFAARGQPA